MTRLAWLGLTLLCAACAPMRPHVGTPLLAPRLTTGLAAPLASERVEAAFQLGQMGIAWDPVSLLLQLEAERRLVERLPLEREPAAREALIAALGRVGRAHGRRALLRELGRPASARVGWALAHLYRRLRAELDASPDVAALATALLSPDADARAGVADALAELKRPAILPVLAHALLDADPLVRARAARGFIELARPDDVPSLTRALEDADERVAAAAALSLAHLAERGTAPTLATDVLLRSVERLVRPAVVIALSEAGLLSKELAPIFEALTARLGDSPRLACAAALAHDRIVGRADRVRGCGAASMEQQRLALRVFAETDPKRAVGAVDELLAHVADAAPSVRAAVASALARYDDPRARAALLTLAADPDPVVWSAAAEGASLAKLVAAGPILLAHAPSTPTVGANDVEPLLSLCAALSILRPLGADVALRVLTSDTPAAVALAARDALATLGVRTTVHPATVHGPYDDLALDEHLTVRVETSRGTIRIALHPDAAPKNVRNFVGLVRRGFYDGLTYHRVVPGFVAQGGDPRGDGSGSAGHLVACEPNATRYVEGTVGMALSGLDTGGSQFFIALAPAPHLEGRYTAFGHVVDGMQHARALQPGDTILRATIE